MSYYVTRGIVQRNAAILELIATAVQTGMELPIPVEFEEISARSYELRKILHGTTVFPQECGGRYRGLKRAVKITMKEPLPDDKLGCILVKPVKEWRPSIDEVSAKLHVLDNMPSRAQLHMIDFLTPPADVAGLQQAIEQRGWQVMNISDDSLVWALKRKPRMSYGEVIRRHYDQPTPVPRPVTAAAADDIPDEATIQQHAREVHEEFQRLEHEAQSKEQAP